MTLKRCTVRSHRDGVVLTMDLAFANKSNFDSLVGILPELCLLELDFGSIYMALVERPLAVLSRAPSTDRAVVCFRVTQVFRAGPRQIIFVDIEYFADLKLATHYDVNLGTIVTLVADDLSGSELYHLRIV